MPHVKNLPALKDTYYESVKTILCSSLEAVEAKYGAVGLISGEKGSLESYVSRGLRLSRETDISVARWVATHGQSLVLQTKEEALLVPNLAINRSDILPLVCVPIRVNGTIIGALQSSFPSDIGLEELPGKQRFLGIAAELIGYVVENATLRRQLQQTEELLRNMNSISLEIQEAERERIALEVHDGIAQTLATALQYLQAVADIGGFREEDSGQFFVRAVGLIRQAIQEIREVISSITPATLDTLGLVPTVRQELQQFERDTGCQVDFRLAAWPNLPKHMEFGIYRIIHEAVNNVRKHAKSPRLKVGLSQENKRLMIRVKDWGIGFIPSKEESTFTSRSMGLFSMRRRAEFLGGTLKINSFLGKGTEIVVDIPWLTEQG